MQDRPTAPELLQAVREFLESEVLPQLNGRRQFHTRVAINVLRILEREWEQEEYAVRAEWSGLAQLLGESGEPPSSFAGAREAVKELNRDLSQRIRSGELDDQWERVVSAVRATVLEKLAIANPGYGEEAAGPE